MHTGIGPFNLESGSYLALRPVGLHARARSRSAASCNFLDAEAPNLLNLDPGNAARPGAAELQDPDLRLRGRATPRCSAATHILSYGGNARRNNFEITLTPNVEDRNEFGALLPGGVLQGQVPRHRWAAAWTSSATSRTRCSRRASPSMFKPTPDHAFRVSFNKAFRSPSAVNNFLDQEIFAPTLDRPAGAGAARARRALRPALSRPSACACGTSATSVGNAAHNLKEESLTAYEVSYTGTFGAQDDARAWPCTRTTATTTSTSRPSCPTRRFPTGPAAASTSTRRPTRRPSSASTPRGSPCPGPIVPFLAAVPRSDRAHRPAAHGLDLPEPGPAAPARRGGLRWTTASTTPGRSPATTPTRTTPRPWRPDAGQLPYLTEELALPAKHRFNARGELEHEALPGHALGQPHDDALWTDVLTSRTTASPTPTPCSTPRFGVKWADGKVTTTLKGTNLLEREIQQHIFGDIIKRLGDGRGALHLLGDGTPGNGTSPRALAGPGAICFCGERATATEAAVAGR